MLHLNAILEIVDVNEWRKYATDWGYFIRNRSITHDRETQTKLMLTVVYLRILRYFRWAGSLWIRWLKQRRGDGLRILVICNTMGGLWGYFDITLVILKGGFLCCQQILWQGGSEARWARASDVGGYSSQQQWAGSHFRGTHLGGAEKDCHWPPCCSTAGDDVQLGVGLLHWWVVLLICSLGDSVISGSWSLSLRPVHTALIFGGDVCQRAASKDESASVGQRPRMRAPWCNRAHIW